MAKNLIIVLFLFILIAPVCLDAHEETRRLKHYTVEEGLSQHSVNAILQDRLGFMWIGTKDGLNRFDGFEFRVFRYAIDDQKSISDNYIHAIREDASGIIWVGTDNGGLNAFDPLTETFTKYTHDPHDETSLLSNTVFDILIDRDSAIWVGTDAGVSKMCKRSTGEIYFKNYPVTPPPLQVKRLQQLSNGEIWVSAAREPLFLNTQTHTLQNYYRTPEKKFPGNPASFSQLWEDDFGRLWGLHNTYDNPMREFDRQSEEWRTLKQPGRFPVLEISKSPDGQVWFLSGRKLGILRFDEQRVPLPELLNLENEKMLFEEMYFDNSGILWLGTAGDGLFAMQPLSHQFKTYPKTSDSGRFVSKEIRSLLEDRNGLLWIGSYSGLFTLNRRSGEYRKLSGFIDREGRAMTMTYTMYEDPLENGDIIWLGSQGRSLFRHNIRTGEYISFEHIPNDSTSLPGTIVTVILRDSSGDLWVGTSNGLAVLPNGSEAFRQFRNILDDSTSLSKNFITSLLEDSEGRLWIGTSNGGINLLNRDQMTFERVMYNARHPGSIKSNNIKCIMQSRSGTIWVGTSGAGFARVIQTKPGGIEFEHFTRRNGLPNNTVYGILEDEQGNLWMSTNRGLSKFNPLTRSFLNFDTKDGLQGLEFNTNAFFKSRSGEMFFGGLNGFNAFYPEKIKANDHLPTVVLTGFSKFNQLVVPDTAFYLSQHFLLNYDDRMITFQFAALDFNEPEKNQFAYLLEGLNKDWIDMGNKREITFAQLNPGKYTLHVRATNNHGFWSENPLKLRITVAPPFWLTTKFHLAVILILVTMSVLFYRWRVSFITRRNRELESIVNEKVSELQVINEQMLAQEKLANLGKLIAVVSHELRNPLGTIRSSIFSLSEMLAGRRDQPIDRVISRAERNIQRCDNIISELLEYTRIPKLYPEKTHIDRFLQSIAEEFEVPAGIEIRFDLQSELEIMIDREQLRRCVINLMENAIHAIQETRSLNRNDDKLPGHAIEIATRAENNGLQIRISDTGVGIPPDEQVRVFEPLYSTKGFGVGLGLPIVKQIIEQHKGEVTLSSAEGQGATFTLTLPRVIN